MVVKELIIHLYDMKRKQKIVDDFVVETLTNSGMKGDELTKHLIIWKTFYLEIKPFLKGMASKDLCMFAAKFIIFVIHYETICIRAYRPLSGSQSTAKDIISMFSSKSLNEQIVLPKKLTQ